jgi:L-ascorbate 6-phosphate lactonase
MTDLARRIQECRVPQGAIQLWWLGQAGYAFKTADGRVVVVDPYLSDAAERLHGFKRMMPAPIAAAEVRADWLVFTHEHTDHFDPDTVPAIAANNPACRFAGPEGCREPMRQAGIDPGRAVDLRPGTTVLDRGLTVRAVPADHGDLSASALTVVLELDGVRVFLSGDTALRLSSFAPLFEPRLDLMVTCINGVYGNLGHLDAALLVQTAKPRRALPCHFWMFVEHGGADPGGFRDACLRMAPETQALLLKPGEGFLLPRA